MYVTTEFRPSPSFLQPTSKPKGVAAGRNPNPFVFGRSRCRRSAPRSWTRHHQANNPPFSILPLLMMFPPRPRRFCRSQSGIAGCSRRAQLRTLSPDAPTRSDTPCADPSPTPATPTPTTHPRDAAAPSRRGGSRPRIPIPSTTLIPTTPFGALPSVPTQPTLTPTTPCGPVPCGPTQPIFAPTTAHGEGAKDVLQLGATLHEGHPPTYPYNWKYPNTCGSEFTGVPPPTITAR